MVSIMDENVKNENIENQEKDLNAIHNKMFDQNTQVMLKDEKMNREYLKRVYDGADMDFLPKEIRLTRTKYYKMVADVEKEIENEIKKATKQLLIIPIVLLCSILIYTFFTGIADKYDDAYNKINDAYGAEFDKIDTNLNDLDDVDRLLNPSIGENDKDVREIAKAYRVAAGVVRAVGWAIFCIGVTIFLFFFISSIKMIIIQKKRKEYSLKRLENIKQEHMMLGTYDAE